MCGGDMSPYSVSGAKPQPPNVFLDIIEAYVSAGKVAVIFSVIRPKSGGGSVPPLQKVGVRIPPIAYPP